MDFSSVPDRLAAILARAALRSRRTASPRLGKQHVLSTTTSELDHVPRTDDQLSRGGGGVPAGDEAASALAALYAMRLANAVSVAPQSQGVIARRLDAMIRRLG
jgi:hypothetical protein